MRGEHELRAARHDVEGGPSPRARGALPPPSHRRFLSGTIPACAGSTDWFALSWCVWRGPSPRARGAHHPQRALHRRRGTIPACAGSTSRRHAPYPTDRDHPRVRGEHKPSTAQNEPVEGPSPRARGAPVADVRDDALAGTIPACAGSTARAGPSGRPRWDHPRVRGEHTRGDTSGPIPSGPSPRARGAPVVVGGFDAGAGTIPACAGSTARHRRRHPRQQDHPRVRGEHWLVDAPPDVSLGPSPRARGAQALDRPERAGGGTIPACAGSTSRDISRASMMRDHPRVRGEHSAHVTDATACPGPSPRARGAPAVALARSCAAGTIPACAGSTVSPLRP